MFVCYECCQVEISATDRLIVHRRPTVCAHVFECDLEASIMGGRDPKMGRRATGKKKKYISILL